MRFLRGGVVLGRVVGGGVVGESRSGFKAVVFWVLFGGSGFYFKCFLGSFWRVLDLRRVWGVWGKRGGGYRVGGILD